MDSSSLNLENKTQEEKSKLFKVWKTLNKMMEDRGYEKNPDANLKFDDFIHKFSQRDKFNGIFTKLNPDEPNSRFHTYFEYIPNQKLNMETVKNFFEIMKESQVDSGIIIISGKFSQQAKQKITEINSQIQVETFTLGELVVNITEHELVPKHILLNKEEKANLLKRYKIKPHQLPKIYVTDPVARYHGLTRGDVVKIVRVSETAGKYITYRIAC